MGERTFDDFDQFAEDYRSIHTDNIKLSGADSLYFAEMKVKMMQQNEEDEALNILDIGCGDGTTELFMQKYFPKWHLVGIDVSEKSIGMAKNKKLANSTFQTYEGTTIPFQANSFDIVFIAGVLHHVNFSLHGLILNEAARVLKKNGRLYLFEHNPWNPLTRHLVKTCIFDKDARLLNNTYTKNIVKKNGFRILSNQFIIFFPRKGVLSKLIFLEKYFRWLPLGGQYFIRAQKIN